MQFFSTLLVGATALVSLVAAQDNPLFFTSTPDASGVQAGQSYDITYSTPDPDTPVEIVLRQGPSGNLNTITTLTSDATGGSYTWEVSDNLFNSGDYALEIRQAGQTPNFSGQFPLTGGEGQSPTSAISTPSSTAVSTAEPTTTESASSTLITTTSESSSSAESTVSTPAPTTTSEGSTSHSTPSPTGPPADIPTGAAANLKSPAALVLGAIAALAYLQ